MASTATEAEAEAETRALPAYGADAGKRGVETAAHRARAEGPEPRTQAVVAVEPRPTARSGTLVETAEAES